ncbi:hypothetical protein CISIN_1g047380mg, partial [Citrus sinensis]
LIIISEEKAYYSDIREVSCGGLFDGLQQAACGDTDDCNSTPEAADLAAKLDEETIDARISARSTLLPSGSLLTLTRYTCSRNPATRCLTITAGLRRSISHKHWSPSFWCWVT